VPAERYRIRPHAAVRAARDGPVSTRPVDLPPLGADEAAHSAALAGRVRAAIDAAGGFLPFSRYMELALYAPGLGYYSAGTRKFGPAGDFITAPELTPLFARCLATQVAEVLGRVGGGDVVELGAGSGALALDLLDELVARDALPERYRILEVSGELRARQRERLATRPELAARVEWLDAPPAAPWRGVLLANEVVDALPVDRFRIVAGAVHELGVGRDGEVLTWRGRGGGPPHHAAAARCAEALGVDLPDGFTGEARLYDAAWLTAVTGSLARGACLLIDYGAARRELVRTLPSQGTVRCYFRHRQHAEPLLHPGLTDITASVDFTTLAEAAVATDLEVAGFATQAHFLLSLGLDAAFGAEAARQDDRGRLALGQAVATLLLPGEMGERFKVLGLTRGLDGPLAGFAFRDLAATL
jgi:SAM-dependent MidA family methyltransferase